MGNSRNVTQKTSGSRRPQTAENSTPRNRTPQKNIETMRVLSNIIIPNANLQDNQLQSWITNPINGQQNAAHAIASTLQHPGYHTEVYQNAWRQEESRNAQETFHGEVALPGDIVDQALAEAINEGCHQNQNVSKEMMVEIIQELSPWSEGDFAVPEKRTTVWDGNNKDKGARSTKKNRRSIDKEGPSKKQKIKEGEKPAAQSSELKNLLEETTTRSNKKEQADSNNSGATANINNLIIIADDTEENTHLETEIGMFSQETEMAIFRQAITIKRIW
jgi:hypothetical protein